MKRLLPRLFSFFLLLTPALNGMAQCSFPLTINTSKDFCLGSSLLLSSDHALRKIVWYRNGQPIDSTFGAQSLDTRGILVATNISPSTICLDTAGNLYAFDPNAFAIRKFTPGSTTGTIVAGGDGKGSAANQLNNVVTIYMDDQGFLYTWDTFNDRIQKWSPKETDGTTLLTTNVLLNFYVGDPHGMLPDCDGNMYYNNNVTRKVMKWTPGADSPVTYATLPPLQYANQAPFWLSLQKDAAGNLFVLDAASNTVWRIPQGSPNGTTVAGNGQIVYGNNTQSLAGDFWVDGDDTLFIDYVNTNTLVRWAPGATQGTTVLNTNPAFGSNAEAMSRDIRGNFYIGQSPRSIVEYKLTTAIDSSLTPGETGIYYAVATDVLGHTQTSDSVYVNNTQAGTPSITITATATSTPVCTPITFTAQTTDPGPNPGYQWDVSGIHAGTSSPTYTYNLFADSDQVYCILTAPAGCTGGLLQDTSNKITLLIDPHGTAAVTISASDTTACGTIPVIFDAHVTNGSAQPTFQWLLGGNPVPGDDSAAYHTDSLRNGDIVTCVITSDDVCGLAKSNSIPVHIITPPTIGPNQTLSIRYGQTVTLNPDVTGTIDSWLWTPGATLSDSTIENPIASPRTTTDYKFTITATGCGTDSGYILVDVYTPLSIPNAFTPNGDGHNDIFYVLTGPTGSQIEQLAVFGRWGQIVFQTHDAAPGDPSRGWNGYLDGQPAPPGTYIYQLVMRFSDGSKQVYKGTLLLIR